MRQKWPAEHEENHATLSGGPRHFICQTTAGKIIPTATLLEHALLTQEFMGVSKALSLVSCDHKTAILRRQIWPTHKSDVVGLRVLVTHRTRELPGGASTPGGPGATA